MFDGLDRCPNTPAGAVVDGSGCAIDSDQDDVPDGVDICPDTMGIRGGDDSSCTLSVMVDAAGEASGEIGF